MFGSYCIDDDRETESRPDTAGKIMPDRMAAVRQFFAKPFQEKKAGK